MAKIFHSGHILVLARRSYERIGSQHSESQIAIILSAVALEGFVNELEHHARSAATLAGSVKAATVARALAEAEDEHASLLLKLDIAHLAMAGTMPDKSGQPYQDIQLLVRLRNLLVHARPEEVEFGQPCETWEHPKIVRSFVSRGVIAAPSAGAPQAWQQYVLVPSVAAWAHNTAVRAAKWLSEIAAEDWLRQFLQFRSEGLTEIVPPEPAA